MGDGRSPLWHEHPSLPSRWLLCCMSNQEAMAQNASVVLIPPTGDPPQVAAVLQVTLDFASLKAATGRGSKVDALRHEQFAAALCLYESLTLPDIDPAWRQPAALTLRGQPSMCPLVPVDCKTFAQAVSRNALPAQSSSCCLAPSAAPASTQRLSACHAHFGDLIWLRVQVQSREDCLAHLRAGIKCSVQWERHRARRLIRAPLLCA